MRLGALLGALPGAATGTLRNGLPAAPAPNLQSLRRTQRRDALFQRRVGGEQALEAVTHTTGNAERRHLVRQRLRVQAA